MRPIMFIIHISVFENAQMHGLPWLEHCTKRGPKLLVFNILVIQVNEQLLKKK